MCAYVCVHLVFEESEFSPVRMFGARARTREQPRSQARDVIPHLGFGTFICCGVPTGVYSLQEYVVLKEVPKYIILTVMPGTEAELGSAVVT